MENIPSNSRPHDPPKFSLQLARLHTRLQTRAHSICKPKTLLGLPVELRLHIYEYLFESTTGSTRHQLALLRTCTQIYSECYSIALPHIQFRFGRPDAIINFWKSLPTEFYSKIRYIKVSLATSEDISTIPLLLQHSCLALRLKELTLVLKPNVLKRWTKDRAFVIDDLYSEFFLVQNVDIIRFQVSKYHDPIPYLAFFAAVVGERTNHLELDSRARRYCGDGKLTYQLARLAAFPEVVRMLNLDEEDMERFPNARWTFTHFGWDRYERAIRARRKQDSIDFSTKLAEMP